MRFISKCDPAEFNLIGLLLELGSSPPKKRPWAVGKEAQQGSFLFLGMSGPNAGIYAVSSILTAPVCVNNPAGNPLSAAGVYTPAQWVSDILINGNLVRTPITMAQMAKAPELAGLVRWFGEKEDFRAITNPESAALWGFLLPVRK